MKLSAVAFLCLSTCAAYGQAPATSTQAPPTRIALTSQTLVLDAAGKPLPFAVWRELLAKKEYQLVPAPGSTPQKPAYQVLERPQPAAQTTSQRVPAPLPPPVASPFFTTGQTLPPFKLRDLAGRTYKSQELLGKIVVLNFWFIGCPPCRQEIPGLNQLVQQNAQRTDVVFLAIALDQAPAVQAFVQQQPYAYALVADGRAVAARYGIASFPANIVLDRQGKVVFHAQIHPQMPTYLQQAIDQAN